MRYYFGFSSDLAVDNFWVRPLFVILWICNASSGSRTASIGSVITADVIFSHERDDPMKENGAKLWGEIPSF